MRTVRRVKRPRQGWRGSSLHGRIHGVFTICLFSLPLTLCQNLTPPRVGRFVFSAELIYFSAAMR
ncbi:hypothetical protein CS535_15215 [Yersinia massiliensis]|nr:hypothetical protein CRN74_14925 [Yersinia frederiksenii]OWF71896.1 hypothetical protein B4902_15830 [Yersinia frederiksenii]PHZ22978.1 hypothetical protein CS535_15215 [Yersinia massiliensis]